MFVVVFGSWNVGNYGVSGKLASAGKFSIALGGPPLYLFWERKKQTFGQTTSLLLTRKDFGAPVIWNSYSVYHLVAFRPMSSQLSAQKRTVSANNVHLMRSESFYIIYIFHVIAMIYVRWVRAHLLQCRSSFYKRMTITIGLWWKAEIYLHCNLSYGYESWNNNLLFVMAGNTSLFCFLGTEQRHEYTRCWIWTAGGKWGPTWPCYHVWRNSNTYNKVTYLRCLI